jgi:hypothetical protein
MPPCEARHRTIINSDLELKYLWYLRPTFRHSCSLPDTTVSEIMLATLPYGLLPILLAPWLGWAEKTTQNTTVPGHCSHNPAGPLNPLPSQLACPGIVDDETALLEGKWAPWSYQPICFHTKEKKNKDTKLCAYTLSSLRGGGGFSIITTPCIAASLAGQLQDPDIAWLEKQRRWSYKVEGETYFEVKELPGKGFGVIATQHIQKDQVLSVKSPIMLQIMDSHPWDSEDILELMYQASNRLPPKEQSDMLAMAQSVGGYIIDDVMNTNTFGVTVGGVYHAALYPEIVVSANSEENYLSC